MSATTVGIDEVSYQRLLGLVEQTGRPATAILEQALADYERKVSAGEKVGGAPSVPVAAEEAELLEDTGRIRMPPRDVRSVVARVVPAGRRAPRFGGGAED